MSKRNDPTPQILLAAMLLSGAAALMYEIVWLRMLARAFGVTIHAVSFLVALYFGGLVLGSLAAARWTRKNRDWLKLYALLEVAGLVTALMATAWMQHLPNWVAQLTGTLPPTVLRFLLAGPALLIPTFFFGATLPILSRHWIARMEQVGSGVGALYAANSLGALSGAVFAGFWAIAWWGEARSTIAAALLNAAAAAAALYLRANNKPASGGAAPVGPALRPGVLFWLFGLSGFCALGYEVLWTRRLVLMLGNSGYAFSLFLLAYLGGTALGAAAYARHKKAPTDLWATFGRLQLLLAVAALASLWVFDAIGLRLDNPAYLYSPLNTPSDLIRMALRAIAIVLPASLVMGYTFPLAARLATPDVKSAGSAVALLYAFNTAGGILGSLLIGFWGIATLGTHKAFLALSLFNVGIGIYALTRGTQRRDRRIELALGGALVLAFFGAYRDRLPDILQARLTRMLGYAPKILYHAEAPAGTATGVGFGANGGLLINGIFTAGTGTNGAVMLSIANSFIENPKSTLFVGVGCGVTLRTASLLGGEVRALDLLAPVIDNVGVFQPGIEQDLAKPEVQAILDDGRNYLLKTNERFDIVLVDASPPLYSAGTVNLYTVEFLELVKSKLTPEGLYALWLPLPSFEDDYWEILNGMAQVFPHIRVWAHPTTKDGVLFFGSQRELSWPAGVIDQRLAKRVRPQILSRLFERDVRAGFILTESEARSHAAKYPVVTDDRPRTEFPLQRLMRGDRVVKSNSFLKKARTP